MSFPKTGLTGEELFLESFSDLESKINSGKPYNFLRASALLRQLLMDDLPLVHAANLDKLKIRFQIMTWEDVPRFGCAFTAMSDLVPITESSPTKTVTLDGLLAARCVVTDQYTISAKQVITLCSNVKGGVHFGKPRKKEMHPELQDLDKQVAILGVEASIWLIHGIAQVVLKGLRPLVDHLKTRKGQ